MPSRLTFILAGEKKEIILSDDDLKEKPSILDIARFNRIYITNFCNGSGACGKCRVILKEKKGVEIKKPELVRRALSSEEIKKGYTLACLAIPERDCDAVVEIPTESMEDEHQVLIDTDIVKHGHVACGDVGIAADIGTTTVAAYLVDLKTGDVIDGVSDYNSQISYGADVMSRINHALEKSKSRGADDIQGAITGTLNKLTGKFFIRNNISKISKFVFSGNTTMIYLLIKKNPKIILDNIQDAEFKNSYNIKADDLGLVYKKTGEGEHQQDGSPPYVYMLPNIANYVGGDIVSDIMVSGMFESDEVSLIIDVGSNGEVALGNRDWMVCCSTSAGPAFEGGETSCGMRATKGAIDRVKLNNFGEDVEYRVIGNKKPQGLCGSGLITLLAELFKNEVIDHRGKFDRFAGIERLRKCKNIPSAYIPGADFSSEDEFDVDIMEYVIVRCEDSGHGKDIAINEIDIQNIIYSKAAIYAGASTLMSVGIGWDDIHKIFIAGGFGNYIDIESAITFGLLPDVAREKYEFIGNGSLKGACEILRDEKKKKIADKIARKTTYFDLSTNSQFMQEYSDAACIPHKNMDLFPTVEDEF